jgi:DNA-directed RNA polymerase specialized sigma24 family protein
MESLASRHLARRCAVERDGRGWNELLRRHGGRIERAVRRALRRSGAEASADGVAELMQDVYCRLLEAGGRVLLRFRGRSDEELSAYLGRVAERVVLDRVRAARAAKRGADRVWPAAGGVMAGAAGTGESPEERLLRRERQRLFLRRCRELVGRERAGRSVRVLRLALLEGWSSGEISAALGGALAPCSVDSLIYRVRRRLAAAGVVLPRRT